MIGATVGALAVAAAKPHVSDTRLIIAALIGIATIVLLIVVLKLHPFLALTIGSGVLAVAAGVPYPDAFTSFSTGLGATVAGVGVLIALGAIIGKLLIDSGGADEIVDTILARTHPCSGCRGRWHSSRSSSASRCSSRSGSSCSSPS